MTARPALPQQQMIEENPQYVAQFSDRRRPINNPPVERPMYGSNTQMRPQGGPMMPPSAMSPQFMANSGGMPPQPMPAMPGNYDRPFPPTNGTPPGMPEIEGESPFYPGGDSIVDMQDPGRMFTGSGGMPPMPSVYPGNAMSPQQTPLTSLPYNSNAAQGMSGMVPLQLSGETPAFGNGSAMTPPARQRFFPAPVESNAPGGFSGMRSAAQESRY